MVRTSSKLSRDRLDCCFCLLYENIKKHDFHSHSTCPDITKDSNLCRVSACGIGSLYVNCTQCQPRMETPRDIFFWVPEHSDHLLRMVPSQLHRPSMNPGCYSSSRQSRLDDFTKRRHFLDSCGDVAYTYYHQQSIILYHPPVNYHRMWKVRCLYFPHRFVCLPRYIIRKGLHHICVPIDPCLRPGSELRSLWMCSFCFQQLMSQIWQRFWGCCSAWWFSGYADLVVIIYILIITIFAYFCLDILVAIILT